LPKWRGGAVAPLRALQFRARRRRGEGQGARYTDARSRDPAGPTAAV